MPSCHNFIRVSDEYYMTFSVIACPGVLAKVVAVLTGFSPAATDVRSSPYCSSVIVPDLLVPLEDSICEERLVFLDFCYKPQ